MSHEGNCWSNQWKQSGQRPQNSAVGTASTHFMDAETDGQPVDSESVYSLLTVQGNCNCKAYQINTVIDKEPNNRIELTYLISYQNLKTAPH